MNRKLLTTAATCALTLAGAGAAYAAAPDIALVERPADRFERAIETHKLETRYESLRDQARKLDAAPEADLGQDRDVSGDQLRRGIDDLKARVEKAKREAEGSAPSGSGDFGLAGGVSQSTLDAIAACESGGNYATDTGNGFYGAYQFDLGTWASVGGSGNPAAALPAEQDYRASLLYSQAGSSPWPVCGV